MQRRVTAFLAGLFLVLSSHVATAAEATLSDVNRALASGKPAVLIGVPADFLNPDSIGDSDDAEAQDDWSYYLNEWTRTSESKQKLQILVVPMKVLSRALRHPVLKGPCATLFVKNRSEGLLFDAYCVLQINDYDLGARWLQGAAAPDDLTRRNFKTTTVVARARR